MASRRSDARLFQNGHRMASACTYKVSRRRTHHDSNGDKTSNEDDDKTSPSLASFLTDNENNGNTRDLLVMIHTGDSVRSFWYRCVNPSLRCPPTIRVPASTIAPTVFTRRVAIIRAVGREGMNGSTLSNAFNANRSRKGQQSIFRCSMDGLD